MFPCTTRCDVGLWPRPAVVGLSVKERCSATTLGVAFDKEIREPTRLCVQGGEGSSLRTTLVVLNSWVLGHGLCDCVPYNRWNMKRHPYWPSYRFIALVVVSCCVIGRTLVPFLPLPPPLPLSLSNRKRLLWTLSNMFRQKSEGTFQDWTAAAATGYLPATERHGRSKHYHHGTGTFPKATRSATTNPPESLVEDEKSYDFKPAVLRSYDQEEHVCTP